MRCATQIVLQRRLSKGRSTYLTSNSTGLGTMLQLRRASESQAGLSKRDAESTLDRACAQLQDLKRKV